jgi:hypothetical protein
MLVYIQCHSIEKMVQCLVQENIRPANFALILYSRPNETVLIHLNEILIHHDTKVSIHFQYALFMALETFVHLSVFVKNQNFYVKYRNFSQIHVDKFVLQLKCQEIIHRSHLLYSHDFLEEILEDHHYQ